MSLPVRLFLLMWLVCACWAVLWVWICVCSCAWVGLWGAGEVKRPWGVELIPGFGPGEPWGELACTGEEGLRIIWGGSTLRACGLAAVCCLCVGLDTWVRGDCWKVGGRKELEELRMIGGPRSASRWGLLLTMEEDEEDGDAIVVMVGGAGVEAWVKPGFSWGGGGSPVYGGLSNSPPNSISWLLMSCSMSKGWKQPTLTKHKNLVPRRQMLTNSV